MVTRKLDEKPNKIDIKVYKDYVQATTVEGVTILFFLRKNEELFKKLFSCFAQI